MEIAFRNVTYIYNNITNLKTALNNINIEIKKEKINSIIGRSGSGKTTLINIIDALSIPTIGTVIVDNYKINKYDKIDNVNNLRSNIGFTYQNPDDQLFNATVRKELELSLKNYNFKTNNYLERCIKTLKLVGLDGTYLNRNPFKLSSGEKRKVALACILIYNPKVIIFDEPTTNLDGNSKNELIKLIRLLKNKYKKTIIIASKDIEFVHKISDNIYVLNDSKIVLSGNKYDVFNNDDYLNKYDLYLPQVIKFSNRVKELKNIKLGYRDDINDLIKDIYRNVK